MITDVYGDAVEFPHCRFVLTIMAFFGFVNIYALRVNLSVAVVCMTNSTAVEKHRNGSESETDNCGNPTLTKHHHVSIYGCTAV